MERTQPPLILAVDDDPDALKLIASELRRRYGSDYNVVCELSRLRRARAAGGRAERGRAGGRRARRPVDARDAGRRAPGAGAGTASAREARPADRLGGVGRPGRPGTPCCEPWRSGTSTTTSLKPWKSPDEFFHRMIAEFIHEWTRTNSSAPQEVVLVAQDWTPRAHELRSLLARNGVPHVFHSSELAGGQPHPGGVRAGGRPESPWCRCSAGRRSWIPPTPSWPAPTA